MGRRRRHTSRSRSRSKRRRQRRRRHRRREPGRAAPSPAARAKQQAVAEEGDDEPFTFSSSLVDAITHVIPASDAFRNRREAAAFTSALRDLLAMLMRGGWCVSSHLFKVLAKGESGTVYDLGAFFVAKQLHDTMPQEALLDRRVDSHPVREMMVQALLASAGLTVAPIAFVQCGLLPRDFANSLLVMRRLPRGCPLDDFFIDEADAAQAAGPSAVRRYQVRLRHIQAQFVAAVVRMHSMGIWHGDLHGNNIWLAEDAASKPSGYRVMLLDFGRSVALEPSWMARFGGYLEVATMQVQSNWREWATVAMFQEILEAAAPGASARERRTGLTEARLMWGLPPTTHALRKITRTQWDASMTARTRSKWQRFLDVVEARIGAVSESQRRSMVSVRHGPMALHAYARGI